MKKPCRRPPVASRFFRVCCKSTFGFFTISVLNLYCHAINDTDVASSGNRTDSRYIYLTTNTWLEGFELCRDLYNLTMASSDDINDRSREEHNSTIFEDDLRKHFPVWTYAFEVKNKTTRDVIQIRRSDAERYRWAITCSDKNGTKKTECCKSIEDARTYCRQSQLELHLPEINPDKFSSFAQLYMLNTSRWVTLENENDFLSESEDLSVRCLLLDENGDLRTDDCKAKHGTLCVGGNSQQVVQYVGKASLQPYTSRHTSGSSSTFTKSPSKLDTHSSTVNIDISTYPVHEKSGIWMDPQIRYSIIAVVSLIVLAIFVAVCCCCCRRRRKTANEGRKPTHLADAYSETADSIAMKETSVYETADTSEYAIPDDAVKKARQRHSIGENEYDVLSKSNKTQTKFTGNAYNHVTLIPSKDRRGSSNQDENTYDVTNIGNHNTVVLSPSDLSTGNVYGEIEIKTDR